MILDELVLHNVRTFAGRQVIPLAPRSRTKPITLIGGLNGAGKTTMLEAIQLALYGSLAQLAGRRKGSYDSYLRGLIHHGVPESEGAAIELAFRAFQQGDERQYRVRRSWHSTGTSIRELLVVSVDGRPDQTLTATWTEHVETFVPRGIAGLFFFDGEQIEALADMERSREVLASALAALLGLDLVDRLSTDLLVLRRRHQTKQLPDTLRQEIEDCQRIVTDLRKAEEEVGDAVASAQVSLERAEKRLHEATEQYRSAGGELLEQRESAETAVAMLRQQVTMLDEELRNELADVAPLLQVRELVTALAEQASREAEAVRNRMVVDVLLDRDRAVLAQLKSGKVRASAVKALEDFLSADVQQRRETAETATIAGITSPAPIDSISRDGMPAAERRLTALLDRREKLHAQLDEAERQLAVIPDPESLLPVRQERDAASDDVVRCQAVLDQAQGRLADLRQQRVRADSAYERAMDQAARATLHADDDIRLIDHVDRVRTTLDGLRAAATRRHVDRIAELIHEALGRLLRKNRLVTDVAIDPDTYTVQLTGMDARPLAAHDLSAGERQLLAVALLWGMARAAGQPLPVIIDTPLGRLDRSHREHLLDRYFPHASHQVILLSTDTEIDELAYDRLRTKVGRSYRLDFDPATSSTSVESGYFWE